MGRWVYSEYRQERMLRHHSTPRKPAICSRHAGKTMTLGNKDKIVPQDHSDVLQSDSTDS